MDNFHYIQAFKDVMSAEVTNIARAGSSNRRIIRTTVDYIDKNNVDFVLLGLTFYDRQESPFVNKSDPWVSYNSQGIQAVFSDVNDYESPAEYQLLSRYVIDRYKYDINEHYLDALYLDLKMFTAYLKYRDIGYCIFNTCDRHHKATDLYDDAGIVPFDFVANEYMEAQGCEHFYLDDDLPANARHHYSSDVIILVKHLANYIKEHKLIERI
jgi:hypothetical protein